MSQRILAASVVNQDPAVFKAFADSLQWQTGRFDVDYLFLLDRSMPGEQLDGIEEIVCDIPTASWLLADAKDDEAKYAVSNETHHWTKPTFYWLAREKQKLIEYAKDKRYDALWLVDSDLICSPDTLSSLWNTEKDVVSGVFYTKWEKHSPALPQVWMQHPYEFQGRGIEAHEFLGSLADRQVVRVAGLGACTLIRAAVLDRVGFWPLVAGLPGHGMWQGEDRHFCITAERNHVELWADAWPDIWHCYRPDQRSQIGNIKYDLSAENRGQWGSHPTEATAEAGDLVSFTLEPLEEPQIAGHKEHVRGRLGAIKMLPLIEKAVRSMRAGDEQILRVSFPLWYPVAPYRGRSKLVRVKLLHCKPYSTHPTESDSTCDLASHFMEVAA